ncbi:AbiH family protein [Myroides odoratimimus]|uniref:AbiH family protein n=1 Tax=Myroides odoratimimus TaxID=76832 RepID=UPI000469481C|nr:AbiH family protein [Myroides odoratimimus]
MPKILITGNGFDLNLGLPTSYSDFIKILIHIESNSISFNSVYSISQNYELISKNFNSFDFDNDKLEKLKLEIRKNSWYKFFKEEFEIQSWIDFENRIEYVLKILFSSVDYLKKGIFDNGPINEQKIFYNSKLFNNNIEIIEVLKNFEIIFLDNDYTIELNTNYLVNKYNFFIDINLEKITKDLYENLLHFKSIFNYYFEIFVHPFYNNIKVENDKNLFQDIDYHYTFNYTPSFENMYKKVGITKFLHGTIDSSTNQIVLGINDIPNSNIDNKYFLPFTKYFQKLNNNTDYVFLKEFEKKLSNNYIFFFYGHSLDTSDEDYINEVFDFIHSLKSKIKRIVIIYRDENSKSKLLINLLYIRGKKNIMDLMRSNVLIFVKSDSNELKIELNQNINQISAVDIF